MSKRLRPYLQRSRSALLHEHKLPIVVAQTGQLLVVVDVKERFTRAFRDLPAEIGYEIIAVEVDLVGHVADFVALEQFVLHFYIASNGQERWQHVEVGDDVIGYLARLDLARPTD